MVSLVGGGFSSAMTPDQLAQWLLQEYGKAYKREIDKLTGTCSSLIGISSMTTSVFFYSMETNFFIRCFDQWRTVS